MALVAVTVLASAPFHLDAQAPLVTAGSRLVWREVQWTAPFDPWPKGREFRCSGGACGSELRLTIRPKIGFCNCATGVADDDELDRVGDLDLIADDFSASTEGHTITVGTLHRVRHGSREGTALGLAAAANCNVVVAAISGTGRLGDTAQAEVLKFLQSPEMAAWARRAVQE
jgi:hypothetical protein